MSDLPDRDRVTAILTLKDAASPLPWVTKNCADAEYNTKNNRGWWWVWQESKLPHYGGVLELDSRPDGTETFNGGHLGQATISDNDDGDQERADAEYIVAACNAFPDVAAALLEAHDTIDRLEGETAKLRGRDDASGCCVSGVCDYHHAQNDKQNAYQNALETVTALHQPYQNDPHFCASCDHSWPCPTWQALNGGNE